jgi:transcriptional regulator with XRE-family HTH domain
MQMRNYRIAKGLTLADVAELMGFISPNNGRPLFGTVHRHESGARMPDIETVERYRKMTGGAVTIDDWLKLRKRKGAKLCKK